MNHPQGSNEARTHLPRLIAWENQPAEEPFCVHQPKAQPHPQSEMDAIDTAILSSIQAGLPPDEHPFSALARQLNLPAGVMLARVQQLQDSGIIRRIGPVFDTQRLGYSSTLVAARVPADHLLDVALLVNELPGVTHNYRREHDYNLWFTLTARSKEEIDNTLASIRKRTGIADIYSLPAVAVYRIAVNFALGTGTAHTRQSGVPSQAPAILGEHDRHLVRLLQESLPVVERPFDAIALAWGRTPADVVERIREWVASGVIRRFGAVVRHQRLGYVANGMCVFNTPAERLDEAGRRLAECEMVSHCYSRPPAPGWSYNLFAMMHSTSKEHVRRQAAALARELAISDHDVLFSTEEFKKASMRFFAE